MKIHEKWNCSSIVTFCTEMLGTLEPGPQTKSSLALRNLITTSWMIQNSKAVNCYFSKVSSLDSFPSVNWGGSSGVLVTMVTKIAVILHKNIHFLGLPPDWLDFTQIDLSACLCVFSLIVITWMHLFSNLIHHGLWMTRK